MLLFVAVPERSTARKICPASPPGFIAAPNCMLPPRLTVTFWSKVGVTAGFCAVLQAWYWNPCPVPLVLSMVNHSLSPPPPPPSDGRRVQDWPPFSEPQMSSQNDCRRLR